MRPMALFKIKPFFVYADSDTHRYYSVVVFGNVLVGQS